MRLTESMIRVTNKSIGADGRIVRDRPLHVFVDRYALKDARGRLRRFGRRGAAYKAAREFIEEHNQRELELCPCVASMGCLCVCHAAGMEASEPCDTSEERAYQIGVARALAP